MPAGRKGSVFKNTVSGLQGLLKKDKKDVLVLPAGWVCFPLDKPKLHLLWICDSAKLVENAPQMSARLEKWLQVNAHHSEELALTVWIDSSNLKAMNKHSLFLDLGAKTNVKFRCIEQLVREYIGRFTDQERSSLGFASETETMVFGTRLYSRAACAETLLGRKSHVSLGGSAEAAEVKVAPVYLLIDLFKHLIVLEEGGFYVDWSLEPFDVTEALLRNKTSLDKRDLFLVNNAEKSQQGAMLHYSRIGFKCIDPDSATGKVPEDDHAFVRHTVHGRLLDVDLCEREDVLNAFHLQTAKAVAKTVRNTIDLMVANGSIDAYFDIFKDVKKGGRFIATQEQELRFAKALVDTPNHFVNTYRAKEPKANFLTVPTTY